MREVENYHPEFRRKWAERIEELLFEFADLNEQRHKWSSRSDRQAWDTFSELICQLYDDQQIEEFLVCYEEVLHPRISTTMQSFVHRLDRFIDDDSKPCDVAESEWIDSPEWKQCTLDAAAVLHEIKRWGWPPLSER